MLDKKKIPRHVAIIMDGNGRWAKDKGLPRSAGHKEGIERVKDIVKTAAELGVKVLTLFAFSTENWARPKKEIDMLMRALGNFLERQIEELNKANLVLKFIGRRDPLPLNIQHKLAKAQEITSKNNGMTVVLALNYGARQEIIDAVKSLYRDISKETQKIEELDEEKFKQYLYTDGLPDPDLLIRTSGELRISNFLLWQLSYAELYFPKKYWPDFKKEDFKKALFEYQRRQRRFGAVA
jgi:undecaprenyl diphosphate synthase